MYKVCLHPVTVSQKPVHLTVTHSLEGGRKVKFYDIGWKCQRHPYMWINKPRTSPTKISLKPLENAYSYII